MDGCVILGTNRAQRDTVRVSLTRRTRVVGLRIPGLRSRRDLDRRLADLLPVDTLLDELIAIRQRLPAHRKRLGAVGTKEPSNSSWLPETPSSCSAST